MRIVSPALDSRYGYMIEYQAFNAHNLAKILTSSKEACTGNYNEKLKNPSSLKTFLYVHYKIIDYIKITTRLHLFTEHPFISVNNNGSSEVNL